ncbi:MAG: PIN domain-containing protein [Candidatus Latescibacteria bacterium]|nr:PIN domain-containing protein [Candidatus Latescibacterota bacterium]
MGLQSLTSLEKSEKVFVDSNILIYHLTQDELYGELSRNFLKRIEEGELPGYTAPVVVSGVLFMFIKVWIMGHKGIAPGKIIQYLKRNPEVLGEIDLGEPIELVSTLEMLPTTQETISHSHAYISKYHLLPNDGIKLSLIRKNGIRNLATQGSDFNNVDIIDVWKLKIHGGK